VGAVVGERAAQRETADGVLTAEELGFQPVEPLAWTKSIAGREVTFRILRSLDQLAATEPMQRECLGLADIDMLAGSVLISCAETGGDVFGAFLEGESEPAGICVGYGGYVNRRPRVLSEILAVRPSLRSLGIGAELKKLQAVVALERGFDEIVWTVDPLRAGNARLNVEKLGAYCDHYEINRYGQGFGANFYGDMPSDRLHMTWEIGSSGVRERLLGRTPTTTPDDVEDLLHFSPERRDVERALIYLPNDVDKLLAEDANAVLRWRLALRETLPLAFDAGYAITGFVRDVDPERGLSAYVISRRCTQ
jgi:predicted GNAT superfamily acetyltransferase